MKTATQMRWRDCKICVEESVPRCHILSLRSTSLQSEADFSVLPV